MPLFYLDASAVVKLVVREPESEALRTFIAGADLVSCELVLTEVPRAIRRAAARDERLPLEVMVARAGQTINGLALAPLDRGLLLAAGALAEPVLRALDAIHVAAAVDLGPIDAFVTYDERQAAAARLAGMRTMSPAPVTAAMNEALDKIDPEPDPFLDAAAHETQARPPDHR